MDKPVRFLALGLAVVVAACSGNTTAPPSRTFAPPQPSATEAPSTPPRAIPPTTIAPTTTATPSVTPAAAASFDPALAAKLQADLDDSVATIGAAMHPVPAPAIARCSREDHRRAEAPADLRRPRACDRRWGFATPESEGALDPGVREHRTGSGFDI